MSNEVGWVTVEWHPSDISIDISIGIRLDVNYIRLTLNWRRIVSQLDVQPYDECQVATDWFSSGMGLTVKWCHIGSLMMKVKWRRIGLQVVLDRQSSGITLEVKWHLIGHQVVLDWQSSGMGLTVKWSHIGSLIKTVQVAMDWSSSGKGSTVKWYHIGSLIKTVQVAMDW